MSVWTQFLPASGVPPTSTASPSTLPLMCAHWVTLNWLLGRLRERLFGIVLLLLAAIGLVPGTSGIIGVLLAVPAIQMNLARGHPTFPRLIASRRLAVRRIASVLRKAILLSKRMMEKLVRPHLPSERLAVAARRGMSKSMGRQRRSGIPPSLPRICTKQPIGLSPLGGHEFPLPAFPICMT